jgi:predicted nucleic-acid-binding protein
MKGLDTNVLLAWLLEGQARHLPKSADYRVSLVVLAELAWVLKSIFKRSRSEIAGVFEELSQASDLLFDNAPVVELALSDFKNGSADFSDYLLARDNEAAGCETTLTLDRKAGRHSTFTLLGS